jgi:hypothetical protein
LIDRFREVRPSSLGRLNSLTNGRFQALEFKGSFSAINVKISLEPKTTLANVSFPESYLVESISSVQEFEGVRF